MADAQPTRTRSAKVTKVLQYAHGSTRRLMGERFLDMLKTLVWVVPLTILIWLYAEREQQSIAKKVTIPISVRISSPNKIVSMTDPADGKIVADLKGPGPNLQAFLARINNNPVIHTLDASTPPGDTQIPASVFTDAPIFVQSGITADTSLGSVRVTVDDVVSLDLVVRQPDGMTGLDGEMRFSPSVVRVSAPRSMIKLAMEIESKQLEKPTDQPYLTIDPAKLATYLKQPGPHKDIPGIPVTLAFLSDPHIRIATPTVSASFVVKQTDATYTLTNVPIWFSCPPDFMNSHNINFSNGSSGSTIPSVVLTGPEEQIRKIKDRNETRGPNDPAVVRAEVNVFDETRTEQRIIPDFHLPDGVRADADYPQEIRVTPK